MPLRSPSAVRRFLRDSRGATITEYAIILFVVAVVAAAGFRFFGKTLGGGMDRAGTNLTASADSSGQPDPAGGGAAGGGAGGGGNGEITTSHGAGGGGAETGGYGGARTPLVPKEESQFGKFAMIALGVVGAGAAFFAAMQGKNAR